MVVAVLRRARFLFPLLALGAALLLRSAWADTLPGKAKRYEIESAVITYEVSGDQKGSEILYFDRWGAREAKHTHTSIDIMGKSQPANSLKILDGAWAYSVDLDRRTAMKMPNPVLRDLGPLADQEWVHPGEILLKKIGGRQTGTGEILGRPCEIWEVKAMGFKTWVWKGIPLQSEMAFPALRYTLTATVIEENTAVSEDKFTIPSDVRVVASEEIAKTFKSMRRSST